MQWYSLLRRTEGNAHKKSKPLLTYETMTLTSLVVCQQLEEYRYFAMFPIFVNFANYSYKEVKETHRCFYEVIFGERLQKAYFDVDVKIGDVSNNDHLTKIDAIELRHQIVRGILKEFDYIEERDIMVFTSHSDYKYSYHIIVDRWCYGDNEETKVFCQKVMKHVEPRLALFIDDLVYKKVQQLRTYKSHKFGSERIKILDPDSKWEPDDEYQSPGHEYLTILGASLVSNCSVCNIAPSLKPPPDPRKKWTGKETKLNEDDPSKCLDLLAKYAGLKSSKVRGFPYSVKSIHGSIISLRRLMPSHCRICDRVHEHEHPYLMVIGVNKRVYFNCRRVGPEKKLYVGQLEDLNFLESPMTIEQMDSVIPDMETLEELNIPTIEDLVKQNTVITPIQSKVSPRPIQSKVSPTPVCYVPKTYAQRMNEIKEIRRCQKLDMDDAKESRREKKKKEKDPFDMDICNMRRLANSVR